MGIRFWPITISSVKLLKRSNNARPRRKITQANIIRSRSSHDAESSKHETTIPITNSAKYNVKSELYPRWQAQEYQLEKVNHCKSLRTFLITACPESQTQNHTSQLPQARSRPFAFSFCNKSSMKDRHGGVSLRPTKIESIAVQSRNEQMEKNGAWSRD